MEAALAYGVAGSPLVPSTSTGCSVAAFVTTGSGSAVGAQPWQAGFGMLAGTSSPVPRIAV